jgi:hypothetical protein
MNDIDIYCFMGNSECDTLSGASSSVNTQDLDVINIGIGFTQIIDTTSLITFGVFAIDEDGYLSNPYMRVVRNYYSSPKITQENKPNSKMAYGATLEYSKSFTDTISAIGSYRFYDDDWDIRSHTLDMTLCYTFNKNFTTGLNFRGYMQSSAYFFSGKRDHFTNEEYASSDRRVSEFDSYHYAVSGTYKLQNNLSFNATLGYYDQPEYFDAIYYNIGLKYSF